MRIPKLPILAVALLLSAAAAQALEVLPYAPEHVETARRTNGPIALHFHSKWCTTCRQQRKVFEQMAREPGLALRLLVVDFDASPDLVAAYDIPIPSVLIVMRGAVERARLIGVTDRDALAAALAKAF